MTYESETNVDENGKGAAQGMAPAERIRNLNDELRTTGIGGTTNLTRGMWAKGSDFVAHAVAAVRAFDAFSEENDPWQEHDCATLDVDGESIIFKIDSYDVNMEYGSPDPADPNVTRRVLTIMLAEEY
jgi:Protein of unknown function (DUF3768)